MKPQTFACERGVPPKKHVACRFQPLTLTIDFFRSLLGPNINHLESNTIAFFQMTACTVTMPDRTSSSSEYGMRAINFTAFFGGASMKVVCDVVLRKK